MNMQKEKKILLSFDIEEFDLPLEYGKTIDIDEQLSTGYEGLLELKKILSDKNPATTFFTTAFFAEYFPTEIKELSILNEIGSHTYFHSSFKEEDIRFSKEKLEQITGKQIFGLRMPRMKKVNASSVIAAGYEYNSSINPTWIPGRYNNLRVSRKIFSENNLIQFPVSVTPTFRIPLFWLAFKNMPYPIFLKLTLQTLRNDGYICLYFHPWEFIDLSGYKLPSYITKGSDKKLSLKLARLINDLSVEGEFSTMHNFLNNNLVR